jgi:DNA polymerase III delta prime subunit
MSDFTETFDTAIQILEKQYLALLHQGPIPEVMKEFQGMHRFLEALIQEDIDQRNKDKLMAALARFNFDELNKAIRAAHCPDEEESETTEFFHSRK